MGSELQLVSSDPSRARALAHIIQAAGYHASINTDHSELFATDRAKATEVLLIDATVPPQEQLELVAQTRRSHPLTQILVIVPRPALARAQLTASRDAYWVLAEPYENEELLSALARATVLHHLTQGAKLPPSEGARRESAPKLGNEIIALSSAMQRLLMRLERMAPLNATVLLSGESGTGKTLLAALLHRLSGRSQGPFHSVSCANLPRDLLESELFGHETGSFTGAHAAKPGVIELCHGGTLFLDELGELPLELQPKLLTFLQDHKVRRVGGRELKSVDVRVICATNRDLPSMVTHGTFREDLFFRINVLNLRVPSLKERREDIQPLAQRILTRIGKERHTKVSLSNEALQRLQSHSWPGNVRELEHVLERAATFCENGSIRAAELELLPNMTSLAPQGPSTSPPIDPTLAGRTLRSVEDQLIRETLELCQGDKVRAAAMMGVSLKTIYNKLRRRGPT